MQAKRIQIVASTLSGAGVNTGIGLVVPTEPREQVNFHNIWASFSHEPVNADANAQGSWILYLRREGEARPSFTDAFVNAETRNQGIIACGVWGSSNQTPFNKEIRIQTSRNLNPGERLELIVVQAGITAGDGLARLMICAHVIRK